MVIKKKFTSETSHIVRNAVSELCRYNIHGHSYKWFVYIKGNINEETGMVLDFKELAPIKEFINLFDHATVFWSKEDPEIIDFFKNKFKRVLVMYKNTTAENMARLVFAFTKQWLKENNYNAKVSQVDVWETETGCAIATNSDSDDLITNYYNEHGRIV